MNTKGHRATAKDIKEAVDDYLSCADSMEAVAKRHGISRVTLYRWLGDTPGTRQEERNRVKATIKKTARLSYLPESDEIGVSYGRQYTTLPREEFMRELDMLIKGGVPTQYTNYSGKEVCVSLPVSMPRRD